MSLTSYRAAPPRASVNPYGIYRVRVNRFAIYSYCRSKLRSNLSPVRDAPFSLWCVDFSFRLKRRKAADAALCIGWAEVLCLRRYCFDALRFADLAATYSPAS